MNVPHFVYPFTCQQTLGCLHLLAIMINAAMNRYANTCLDLCFQFLWVYPPEVELLDHKIILYLISVKNHHTTSHCDRTILHPNSCDQDSNFSTSQQCLFFPG